MDCPFICHVAFKKYDLAGRLIRSGEIKKLDELLSLLDKTPFARAMNTTPERLNRIMTNLELVTLKDIHSVAALLSITPDQAFQIFEAEHLSKRKRK